MARVSTDTVGGAEFIVPVNWLSSSVLYFSLARLYFEFSLERWVSGALKAPPLC